MENCFEKKSKCFCWPFKVGVFLSGNLFSDKNIPVPTLDFTLGYKHADRGDFQINACYHQWNSLGIIALSLKNISHRPVDCCFTVSSGYVLLWMTKKYRLELDQVRYCSCAPSRLAQDMIQPLDLSKRRKKSWLQYGYEWLIQCKAHL